MLYTSTKVAELLCIVLLWMVCTNRWKKKYESPLDWMTKMKGPHCMMQPNTDTGTFARFISKRFKVQCYNVKRMIPNKCHSWWGQTQFSSPLILISENNTVKSTGCSGCVVINKRALMGCSFYG